MVRKRFRFLIEDYGFEIIHEEYFPYPYHDALVIFQSDSCRIRVLREQDRMFMEIGPLSAATERTAHEAILWFDVRHIMAFLFSEDERWHYDYADEIQPVERRQDEQLAQLAAWIQPYIGPMCKLFAPGEFERREIELKKFRRQRMEARFGVSKGTSQ